MIRATLVLLLSLAASAAEAPAPRLPAGYLQVPHVRQATSYSCGTASMLSVLYYWKAFDGKESDLYPLIGTREKDGTDPRDMAEAARKLGLQASLREGLTVEDLGRALEKGETVILDIQAWHEGGPPRAWEEQWEDGHYVVLVGTDSVNAYLMDPSLAAGYGYVPLSELPARWHDYEDRGGKVWRNRGLGLVISGKEHIAGYPAALEKVE